MLNIFAYCSGLTSVTIPNSVTSIGDNPFASCRGLTTVKVESGNAVYDSHNNCNAIIKTATNELIAGCKNTVIPNSITSVGNSAFYGCSGLTSVTIPNSVTYIGWEAFYRCSGLTSVTALPETPPTMYDSSFSNYNIPLYASKTAIDAYQTTSPWSKFAQFLVIEDEMPQCATPTITFSNGKLMFDCETEDVEYAYEITTTGTTKGVTSGEVVPDFRCAVSVYAMKEGYENSDAATLEFTIGGAAACDVNGDGTIDVADIATIIDAMATQAREQGRDMP